MFVVNKTLGYLSKTRLVIIRTFKYFNIKC